MALSLSIAVPATDPRALRAALWVADKVWKGTKNYGKSHSSIIGGQEFSASTTNHESADCGPWKQHTISAVLCLACPSANTTEGEVLRLALTALEQEFGESRYVGHPEMLAAVREAGEQGYPPADFWVRRMTAPHDGEGWEICGPPENLMPNGWRYEYIGGELAA